MAVQSYGNVRVLANSDSIKGPGCIKSAVLVPGSTNSTATLTNGASVKFLDFGTVTASGPAVSLQHLNIRLTGNDTITAALTGTGALLYLYLE